MRRYLLIAAPPSSLLAAGGAVAYKVLSDEDPPEKRGSATEEFDATDRAGAPEPPKRKVIAEPWPTFGYDNQRTQGLAVRPPPALPAHLAGRRARHARVPALAPPTATSTSPSRRACSSP